MLKTDIDLCVSACNCRWKYVEHSLADNGFLIIIIINCIYIVNYSTLCPLSHRNKIGDKFGDPTTVTV